MRCIESGGGKMNIIGFIASVLMVIKSTFALFLKKKNIGVGVLCFAGNRKNLNCFPVGLKFLT